MSYVTQIESTINNVFNALNYPIRKEQIIIEDLGVPHKPKGLPHNKMAVYMFIYEGTFFKIGQAYKNSGARYLSQHYTGSAPSTLRAQILSDSSMKGYGLTDDNIANWMKNNLHRINIIIDAELGKATLTLIESIMHFKYKPKYEGKSK